MEKYVNKVGNNVIGLLVSWRALMLFANEMCISWVRDISREPEWPDLWSQLRWTALSWTGMLTTQQAVLDNISNFTNARMAEWAKNKKKQKP